MTTDRGEALPGGGPASSGEGQGTAQSSVHPSQRETPGKPTFYMIFPVILFPSNPTIKYYKIEITNINSLSLLSCN